MKQDSVDFWVQRRREDLMNREFALSLNTVGLKGKALGSQCVAVGLKDSLRVLWRKPYGKENIVYAFRGFQVWVYKYDPDLMIKYLLQFKDILRRYGWPLNIQGFIEKVRMCPVKPGHPLYAVIAYVHGDTTNPGLPHQCPGWSRHELLDRYHNTYGEEDPASIFFEVGTWPSPVSWRK